MGGAVGGAVVGVGAARLWRMAWSSWSLWSSLSARGCSGELRQGFCRALAKSAAAVRTRSVALGAGMATWRGNHLTVSQMQVALVLMHHNL
jgi:hypothetical protein